MFGNVSNWNSLHILWKKRIQKNVKTRFLFNKLKTTTLYRPTLHNSIPKFWRQQFRARSGFNIAGSGRAGPIMPNSKSGRVGPGRNYIGPGWAGPKKLGPCRPLVHKFVQHIGCVHKQNLPRAISSGARPFINYLWAVNSAFINFNAKHSEQLDPLWRKRWTMCFQILTAKILFNFLCLCFHNGTSVACRPTGRNLICSSLI